MKYTVIKESKPRKKSSFIWFHKVLIVLGAIPVFLMAVVALLLMVVEQAVNHLLGKKTADSGEEPYYIERSLLTMEGLEIQVIDDERDTRLTETNERWTGMAYHDDDYLYRARTQPIIPELHNKIVCFYLKEQSSGAFLQVIEEGDAEHALTSSLVYLTYPDLQLVKLGEIGIVHLYNHPRDPENVIRGFNDNEEITLTITAGS